VDIQQIRALIYLADSGSFSEAARRSNWPRSTLRRRVAELEADLQVSLIQAAAGGVELTAAGLQLVQQGRGMVRSMDRLEASLRGDPFPLGVVRIAMPFGLHPSIMTITTRLLMTRFPDMRFKAVLDLDPAPSDFDIGIQLGPRPPEGPYVAKVVARAPLRLMASRTYAMAHGLPASIEEIADHPLLAFSLTGECAELPLIDGGHVPVTPRVVTPDLHYLHWAGRSDLGIIWTGDGDVPEPAGVEPLQPVLADVVGGVIPAWMLTTESLRSSPEVREVVAFLTSLADTVLGTS